MPGDLARVARVVRGIVGSDIILDHGTARTIGSMYADDSVPATGTFSTTGEIVDGLVSGLFDYPPQDADEKHIMDAFRVYVKERQATGRLGPIAGWSGMWVI